MLGKRREHNRRHDAVSQMLLPGEDLRQWQKFWKLRVDLPAGDGPVIHGNIFSTRGEQVFRGPEITPAGGIRLDLKGTAASRKILPQLECHGYIGRLLRIFSGHFHLPTAMLCTQQQRGRKLGTLCDAYLGRSKTAATAMDQRGELIIG